MRIGLVLTALASLGLGGCNMVMSDQPMFGAADAKGAPLLKPGFWSRAECGRTPGPADPKDCLDGIVVTRETVSTVDHSKPGAADQRPEPAAYLLADGDPLVLQSKATAKLTEGGKGGGEAFIYMAISPTARDGSGRVVEAAAWPVQCGPPTPADKPAAPSKQTGGFSPSTLHPFAGLKLTPLGCEPADAAAVRNAARRSRSVGEVLALRWLSERPPASP